MSISIHALREEGDGRGSGSVQKKTNFYPRPPRGGRPSETLSPVAMHSYVYPRPPRGGRRGRQQALKLTSYFYPRPPRGGRPSCSSRAAGASYFYPRPPRGGRPSLCGCFTSTTIISIHALREEGDVALLLSIGVFVIFLSTPSARRATLHYPLSLHFAYISIHALREEGDPAGVDA